MRYATKDKKPKIANDVPTSANDSGQVILFPLQRFLDPLKRRFGFLAGAEEVAEFSSIIIYREVIKTGIADESRRIDTEIFIPILWPRLFVTFAIGLVVEKQNQSGTRWFDELREFPRDDQAA